MKKIWHPWHKWECYKDGFYDSCADLKMTKEYAQQEYKIFLSCLWQFETALECVINEWTYSCEHFLSNKSLNKIAWLGQASAAYAKGLPSEARGGFKLLSIKEQNEADTMALKYYTIWKEIHDNKSKKISKHLEKKRLQRGYS